MKKLTLLQFLGILAAVIWLIVFVGTIYILPNIPKASKDEIRRVIEKDTAGFKDFDYSKGKLVSGVKISEVLTPNQELLKLGETTFKESCASCHGNDGKGDGVGGAMLNPKPRNFHVTEGWKNGRELTGMFKTLVEGIPGSGMNAYEFLPVKTRFALIYYIRSFTNDYPPITEKEINAINEVYDITKDTKSGAQIPIKVAIDKLMQENKKSIDKYITNIEKIDNPYKNLFLENVELKEKAILILLNNISWMDNFEIFKEIINSNTGANGFKPSVNKLSNTGMQNLYNFLRFNLSR